jgi:hypothetical protein
VIAAHALCHGRHSVAIGAILTAAANQPIPDTEESIGGVHPRALSGLNHCPTPVEARAKVPNARFASMVNNSLVGDHARRRYPKGDIGFSPASASHRDQTVGG